MSFAISINRKLLDISPGQVPSLRAEPQIKSTRVALDASFQRACASSIFFLVTIHSVDNLYEGLFKGELKPVFPHDLPALKVNETEIIRETPFGKRRGHQGQTGIHPLTPALSQGERELPALVAITKHNIAAQRGC